MKEIARIEEITGCKNLVLLEVGMSTTKFKGIYKGKPILVRRFHERDYYGNRFKRENFILKFLENISNSNLVFPKIIKEFPDHDIHVLSWIEGESLDNVAISETKKYEIVKSIWETITKLPEPNDFKFNHFRDIRMLTEDESKIMNISKTIFLNLKDKIWKSFNKSIIKKHSRSIIHGDLHDGNIIVINLEKNQFGVIDWEFASIGSKYFDLAYYCTYSNRDYPSEYLDEMRPWEDIIKLLITHWFLSNFDNYPSEAKQWLDTLRKEIMVST
ncbi:MAG: hypothetical protein HeimC2_06460 [Candidatus Heimdallarchaeota archaeon LC_2]|nr:MAG: hypothetical protein HeimC2_06460 [Candidatus Heimdallarchaeota archaeon LC_2]